MKPIPDEHHVVRYVPPSRLRKDKDRRVIGALHTAFEMKPIERAKKIGISVTWLEYFAGTRDQQIEAAIKATRASLVVNPKSGYVIGNVGAIKRTCAHKKRRKPHRIRIVQAPTATNKAHGQIRQFDDTDLELLEELAVMVCNELLMDKDIPA